MARKSLKNVCRLIECATQNQPIEKLFVNDLKRSIELTADNNSYKPSQTYKPSGLHCIRNMYYQITGKEPDIASSSACLVGICESGTDRHERVQNAVAQMKDNGIDCEYVDVAEYVKSRNLDYLEVKSKRGNETHLYYKDLNMSFLCDGIIRYKGKYYILEIKTESIYKWQARQNVNPDHILQGTAYSTALKIDNVLFLYINRDNCDMKAYMLNVSDEMKNNLIARINECDGYASRFICPPKPDDVSKKACEYCNYRKSCREDN